jgi:undecaprenyl pyrophosphate phosphatase UppP
MPTLAARIQKWIWMLVYAGIVLLGLGLMVRRDDAAVGWGIAGTGIALIVVGIVLIWVRSRMKNTKETP